MKQPKKGWLLLNDGLCIRLHLAYHDHVCSYDFVHHRTEDDRATRPLNIVDDFTREYIAIQVDRKPHSINVVDVFMNQRISPSLNLWFQKL